MDVEKNPWTILSTQKIYDNPWISLAEHKVLNPSGNEGIYGAVHFKNYALGILPLDEQMNTYLVGQYRFTLNEYSWEIPEGGGALDCPPLESAKRELKEETGLVAKKWDLIQTIHLSNSVSDEFGMIYLATGLEQKEAQPEDTEQLVVKKLPFKEALEMVLSSQITDSLSVAGILKAHYLLERGLLK